MTSREWIYKMADIHMGSGVHVSNIHFCSLTGGEGQNFVKCGPRSYYLTPNHLVLDYLIKPII